MYMYICIFNLVQVATSSLTNQLKKRFHVSEALQVRLCIINWVLALLFVIKWKQKYLVRIFSTYPQKQTKVFLCFLFAFDCSSMEGVRGIVAFCQFMKHSVGITRGPASLLVTPAHYGVTGGWVQKLKGSYLLCFLYSALVFKARGQCDHHAFPLA